MNFTFEENNILIDAHNWFETPLHRPLLQFLNLDINDWIKEYNNINTDNFFGMLFDLAIVRNQNISNELSSDECSTEVMNCLSKDSLDEHRLDMLFNNFYDVLRAKILQKNELSPTNLTRFESLGSQDFVNREISLNGNEIYDELFNIIKNAGYIEEIINDTTNNYIEELKEIIFLWRVHLRDVQQNLIIIVENQLINKNSGFFTNFKNLELKVKIDYDIRFLRSKLMEFYTVNNIDSFGALIISKLLNSELIVKKCLNCKDFFVPTDPREIYCDKIHSNGRSCKEMGYENKVNSDVILREYRKVYKNKNAAKNRNKHNPKSKIVFEQWVHEAKLKREMCKDGDITLDEFKKWLYNK